MKSACSTVSGVLALCLVGSPIHAAAREGAGPIEASIAREAARLATIRQQDDAAADGAWRRVTELAPGTRILVTVRGVGPVPRRIVSGDLNEIRVVPSDSSPDSPLEETVPRSNVLVVTLPAKNGSIWAGLIAGGATFAFVGFPAALGIAMETQCQPNCGAVKAGVAALMVGLPIGAGYAAYRLIGRAPERTIYRAPNSSFQIPNS